MKKIFSLFLLLGTMANADDAVQAITNVIMPKVNTGLVMIAAVLLLAFSFRISFWAYSLFYKALNRKFKAQQRDFNAGYKSSNRRG